MRWQSWSRLFRMTSITFILDMHPMSCMAQTPHITHAYCATIMAKTGRNILATCTSKTTHASHTANTTKKNHTSRETHTPLKTLAVLTDLTAQAHRATHSAHTVQTTSATCAALTAWTQLARRDRCQSMRRKLSDAVF